MIVRLQQVFSLTSLPSLFPTAGLRRQWRVTKTSIAYFPLSLQQLEHAHC